MKKITKYLSAALLTLSLASCNDWLNDVDNKSSVDDATVFNTAETIDLYVNGFYTWLNTYGQFGERQFSGSWTEAMTDIFKYSGSNLTARGGQPNLYSQLAVPMSPGGNLYGCWDNAYSCIRRLNQFLTLEEKFATGYTAQQRAQWQAQARFFRAFMYFQLARCHGGVILYTELPTGSSSRGLSV